MKVSIGIGGAASGRKRDFDEQVDYVVEAENASWSWCARSTRKAELSSYRIVDDFVDA